MPRSKDQEMDICEGGFGGGQKVPGKGGFGKEEHTHLVSKRSSGGPTSEERRERYTKKSCQGWDLGKEDSRERGK